MGADSSPDGPSDAQQHPNDADRGYFRRPWLLGPMVGFLAFLGSEAMRKPASGSADWPMLLPLMLVLATVVAAIPYLGGAYLLWASFRALPRGLVRHPAFRMLVGALIGGALAWPFAHILNWIPSGTAAPRFNLYSMIIGCAVAGSYCAVFFTRKT